MKMNETRRNYYILTGAEIIFLEGGTNFQKIFECFNDLFNIDQIDFPSSPKSQKRFHSFSVLQPKAQLLKQEAKRRV